MMMMMMMMMSVSLIGIRYTETVSELQQQQSNEVESRYLQEKVTSRKYCVQIYLVGSRYQKTTALRGLAY